MKRYVVFYWYVYEACGGWNDVVHDSTGALLSWDTKEEAIAYSESRQEEESLVSCYQVVDLRTGELVAFGY